MADARARVRDGGPRGMIALKGELSELGVAAELTGAEMPRPGAVTVSGGRALLWMARDELLVLVAPDEVGPALDRIREALGDIHHLAADVSDLRATFVLEGPACRDVLAKLTPADVSPAALPPGVVRRTRIGQVAAAFWFRDDDTAEVVCFRSVAGYMRDLLADAAQVGSEVGHHVRPAAETRPPDRA